MGYSLSCFVKCQATKNILITGAVKDGLYCFDSLQLQSSPSSQSHSSVLLVTKRCTSSLFQLWHSRLGHPSPSIVNSVLKSCNYHQFTVSRDFHCASCAMSKTHKLPFTKSFTEYTKPLQLIHSDVWGPAPIVSSNGFRYFVNFIDAHTRFTWLYLLKNKSDVAKVFIQFKKMVELQFNHKIKMVQSDGGGEYTALKSFFNDNGIVHRISCPYTQEQNGVAERKHRHVVDMGLSLLHQASLPSQYWDEAFLTSTHLINRLPTPVLHHKTPYEALYHKPPTYSHLKIFGCSCFPNLRPYNSNNLQFRFVRCTFLGYNTHHKGYRCLDPNGRIFISRDVLFDETTFPHSVTSSPSSVPPSSSLSIPSHMPSIPLVPSTTSASILPCDLSNTNVSVFSAPLPCVSGAAGPSTLSASPTLSSEVSSSTRYLIPPHNTHLPSNLNTSSPTTSLSSTRYLLPPTTSSPTTSSVSKLVASKPHPPPPQAPPHRMTTHGMAGIFKPRVLTATREPTSVRAALSSPEWREAMSTEYKALLANHTWDLVDLPPGRRPIDCKWVFRIKQNPNGTVNCYKARLVAKGFQQKAGFDFREMFSPVVKPVTVRLVLSIALSNGWSLRQLDVNNAFLNGHLNEKVYMFQPPGFHTGSASTVCRLRKSLYGLRQAPRAWFDKLKFTLLKLGFVAAKSDSSLFIRKTSDSLLYLLVYVDDIILTGSNSEEVAKFVTLLHTQFALKDLGPLSYFLGIHVTPTTGGGLILHQTKYISDLLAKVNMHISKPQATPMVAGTKLLDSGSASFDDPHFYRATVGALQYICITRPDLAYSVNKVSQFMQHPRVDHWQSVKRIVRYLQGTRDYGLHLQKSSSPRLTALCDADWASDPVDRRSTSGFCVYFGSNLISWISKKQPVVSRSSTEAEYRALALVVAELLWVQALFRELCLPQPSSPPIVFCDNMSTVMLSANPILHSRTKHLELDLFFVREKVQQGSIHVTHISSKDQIADILTKPLPKSQFLFLRSKLNVQSSPLSLRGDEGST